MTFENGQSVRVDRTVPSEWEQTLSRVIEEVRVTTGLDVEASLRWVSAEEQRAADDDLERRLADPNVRVIRLRLGSVNFGSKSRSARNYEGYWVLVLPGEETLVQDDADLADVIEDYVIEEVWERTGSAPRPGFLGNIEPFARP